jgi:glycosyltransferase involved in cell wall biosynthesis
LIRDGEFDVILNYAVPTYGLQVGLLGGFYKVPVLQRALDVASKIRKSLWNPLIALFEKVCFKLATEVSTNNPAMSKYVLEVMGGGFANKIVMHYPPLDERIFKQTPRDERLASALGIATTDKVVMYMGSFFYFSGLDDVINNMPEQLLSTPDLKLLLIGGGEQEALLRELVEKHKLQEKVIFTGFVPFHDLPRYMTLGNVAINPLQVSTVAGAAFPHKVLQYMAVGIPTVSTKLEGLYAAFGDESGLVWTENSPQTLAVAVQALHASEPERTLQIRIQREVLNSKFSVEATTRALEDSLKQLSIGRGK